MGRRRFLGRVSGRDCSSYLPGLYTVSELDQMIFVDGYIPVANATEFNNIRTGNLEDMGAGTCWENKYSNSNDAKYVQVLKIDFDGIIWNAPINVTGDFIYDGNELKIETLTGSSGLFVGVADEIINMRVIGVDITANQIRRGAIANTITVKKFKNNQGSGDVTVNAIGPINNPINGNNSFAGGLVGFLSGTGVDIQNNFFAGNIIGAGNSLGGIFGMIDVIGGNLKNCEFSLGYVDCLRKNGHYGISGGISGVCRGMTKISLSYNYGEIIGGKTRTGGLFGDADGSIEDCVNYGKVSANGNHEYEPSGVGGIIGHPSIAAINIYRCLNYGKISGANYTGGIIGNEPNNLEDCVNYGDVSGGDYTAGIVGSRTAVSLIKRCVNFGKIISGGKESGGIIGQCRVAVTLKECANLNDVSSTGNFIGGLAGSIHDAILEDCIFVGKLTGALNVGGIYGAGNANSKVKNCLAIITSTMGGSHGVSGRNDGTVTNTYWDKTIGPATSFKGIGKTTSELQTPTSNTGIYANWDPLIWDFGTSSEYPKLINTP